MKKHIQFMKGKKALSLLLAMVMMLSVASPAFSSMLGIIANAATGDPVELAFNNLFVFEKWATSVNSTTMQVLVYDEAGNPKVVTEGATLTTDIVNGSFTFTKNDLDAVQAYTAHSGDTKNAAGNQNYYSIDVKPNTTYTFYYNVTDGNVWSFTPYVFFFNDKGLYANNFTYKSATNYGANQFNFTTPNDVTNIQIRFTIGDTASNHAGETSFYATVEDIAICKTDVTYPDNLFSFYDWSNNTNSSSKSTIHSAGTVAHDSTGSITLTTNNTGANLFTGFSYSVVGTNAADFYSIPVTAGETYTLYYNLDTSADVSKFMPHVAWYTSDGKEYTDSTTGLFYVFQSATINGINTFDFTVPAGVTQIQIAFAVSDSTSTGGLKYTVNNIGLYKSSEIEYTESKFDPHRMVFTEGAGNYTNLPTPTIPEGKVFAGWYTGEDGTGKLITADTEISYESYTVYPKFETAVDVGSLKVITQPTKTTYTVGEKFNPAGLVLQATVTATDVDSGESRVNTYNITSGYTCSPQTVSTSAGTQNITISYGGQTATVPITVVDSIDKTVTVNGTQATVAVANNEYTLNLTSDFNRYELTYYSDSYVKGTLITVAADSSTVSEEFFLEPSNNGSFASYIDVFLDEEIYTNISTIKFEVLNKEFGNFELYSVETILAGVPADNMQYQQDSTHKVGIDLSMGGSIAYLEELSGNVVASYYGEGQAAQVDYKNMISGGTQVTEGVNLINRHDPGRFVQQSYYGTREDPYVVGDYNGVTWNYNPVQGGNYMFESSKIIDYRITAGEIYVKTRPLDWGKYSDEFANSKEGDYTDNNNDGDRDEGELMLDPRYGDDYITDSYMEAWYVFEDNMVKTYCRFVDYSGYPSNTTTQELPAFYPIEPLNTFAYYNGDTVWEEESAFNYAEKAYKENEPDFWGVSSKYNNMLKANGKAVVDPKIKSAENWAAFMGSDNENSFGIGIYSAGVTEFHYGTYPQIYQEPAENSTTMTSFQFNNADMYEEGVVTMPDMQDATSYIAPVDTMTFESYKPYSYSFYIASGTLHDIREDFRRAKTDDEAAANAETKIAVPETAYMTPSGSDANSTIGQYYVNNILNANNNYSIQTVSERADTMSFGVHINGATKFTVDIVNVTNSSDDIDLYDANGNEVANTHEFALGEHTGYAEFDDNYTLRFNSTGLAPNGKATAKWIITGYDANGNVVGTYTAYTVMYAPGLTVGAVAEGRITSGSNNEISSWITGANGVDHSQRAPLGSFHGDYHDSGRFIYDPLVYKTVQTPAGAGSQSEDDYIVTTDSAGTTDDYGDNAYVLQTATDGAASSRAQSYLGLLKIDKSRYTNTNQIPNLEIGFDALRISSDKNNSLQNYDTYYVLGTAESYTATSLSEAPSGWTHYTSYTDTNSKKAIPFRETVVPAYTVSDDMEGKYIHALNQGKATYSLAGNNYSTAGTSVLLSLTDKAALRDSVTQGYGLAEEKYSEDSYSKFEAELKEAATVLGDPSASQEEIDNAQKDLDDAIDTLVNIYYSLKYDNLFSAYEFSQCSNSMVAANGIGTVGYNNGSITIANSQNTKGEEYTNYNHYNSTDNVYKIDLKTDTEYVFEFDVESTSNSQALVFLYNATGGAGDTPTNIFIQTDDSEWVSTSTDKTWIGTYEKPSGKYAIKFKTGSNTTQAGFRFGNNGKEAITSTFSNIRFVEASKYYEDATYSATEAVYKEYASYGTMVTPTRPGYTFTGWQDASGNAVTGADIATENLSVYSQWTANTYALKYDNLFSAYEYSQHSGGMIANNTNATVSYSAAAITIESNNTLNDKGEPAVDINAGGQFGGNHYNIAVQPSTEYVFEYDVDTVEGSQLHLFVYDSDGGPRVMPSARSWEFTPVSGTKSSGTYEDGKNYFMHYYAYSSGHVVLRFTTPENAEWIGFRFGNVNSNVNESTFSNIRLIEASKYDTAIDCSEAEDVFSYESGTYSGIPTPVREGYTFDGWYLEDGTTKVTEGTAIIPAHTSVYSKWSENSYTIVYNANGATGSVAPQTVGYTNVVTLSDGTGLTKKGYVLLGWSESASAQVADYPLGDKVSELVAENGGSVTLYAVWVDGQPVNIAFDNLIDYGAWIKTTKGIDNITDTGFTVNSMSGETTSTSPLFDITRGKTYRVDVDIVGDNWDVYFFFCDANGAWVDMNDGVNRFSSTGHNLHEKDGNTYSALFTIPENNDAIVKACIRVDANDGPNTVRFENIRVYEDTGIKLDVVNKMVDYDDPYGTLPTPVKYGYVFDCWVDANGKEVDESTIMKSQKTVFLTSKWSVDPNFINDDTVVIDYGLPVEIDILSNDSGAEKVTDIRIGKVLSAGTALGNMSYTDSKLSDANTTVTLANGTATLNADNTVTYTPTSTNFTAEEVFYYEVYDGTNYYYASVTIIPATSIYYEETLFTFRDGQGYKWTDVGSDSGMPTLQDIDRVGELNVGTDSDNPYGYDSAYETSATYSLGKAKYTSVDEYAWGKEPEAEFVFTGRGFDLFSVTNNDTGALTAQVFKYNTETSEYEQVEYFFVDTYFGYNYENGAYVPNPDATNAMYQVPVMSARNLESGYGTYKVIIKPLYSSYFDPNYTSGAKNEYGIYVDSVRIFDPMGENSDIADNTYLADNEFAPQYLFIRDTIISEGKLVFPETGTDENGNPVTHKGSVFVDGDGKISSYSDALPTNEVYLNEDQSIAFHIVTDSAVLPATVQMGMKLTGYNSNGATVKFTDASTPTQSLKFNLTSATEMFYRVDSILEWTLVKDAQGNDVYKTVSPIVITNTSDTVVSLSTLKWTFGENATTPTALSFMVDMETPVLAKAAVNHINAEENTTPNPALDKDNISVAFTDEPYAVGDNGTLIITTEQGVAGVTVDGADVLNCETDENGKLKWTYEFTIENTGSTTFNVVACDENGATSETVYAVTYVEADDTESGDQGDGEDTTTPEGDGSDSESGSGSGITLIPGDELFAHNLIRLLFQFFEKILGMLSGGATV